MDIVVKPNTKIIKTGELYTTEDVELYLPKSVEEMGIYALSSSLQNMNLNVKVYYEGTMEEFKKILKGGLVETTIEDYYGWYYHNAPRYENVLEYRPWYHTDIFNPPVIYCSDGVLEHTRDYDETFCRNKYKEKK